MSTISVTGSNLGSSLQQLLLCDEIEPGSTPSYQICKAIYLFHPLGGKMVDAPISVAQSQQRQIRVPAGPEGRLREAFQAEWDKIGADGLIAALAGTARTYGVGSVVYGAVGVATDVPIEPGKLADLSLYFNVLDPLNTSGSLVLSQDPNAPDFQKHTAITAAGQVYHRSRAVVLLNERPVYIAYTGSAFGYVGRSVYQRALFPLKSFVQSMVTDDMVTKKAGLLIAKLKQAGSIIDNIMATMAGVKRQLLKEATTNNVMSIDVTEDVSSLNMENVDKAMVTARTNVLKNIATAADMPAKMLENETMVAGFGEGTEDAKNTARYIDRIRLWMQPAYDFMDDIVQWRAWNPEFYRTIQAEFPEEYGDVSYTTAFYRWRNSFQATWPSLLIEPESDQAKTEDVKQKAVVATWEVLLPMLDPENRARLIQWGADNMGENKLLFPTAMDLDYDALREYEPPADVESAGAPTPFAAGS